MRARPAIIVAFLEPAAAPMTHPQPSRTPPGGRVVVPGGEEVVAGDISLVAQGHEGVHPESQVACQVEHGDADSAGLGGDGQAARGRDRPRERCVEPHRRVVAEQPQTVGTDKSEAVVPRDPEEANRKL